MLARRTPVEVLRATSRGVPARPLARTASAPKTESGGFAPWPRHRIGRTASQPTVAPGKNRPRYDFARRGAVLPQNGDPADVVVTGNRMMLAAPIPPRALEFGLHVLWELFSIPEACCFTAGTLVSTPSGSKPIETLKVGDLVMSRSDKTGETAVKPIVSITPAHERRIWSVTVSYKDKDGRWADERYETTDDHPWRTADGRWVASANLKQSEVLAREDGTGIVAGVIDTKATKLTYNLEIAQFHTYFVGNAQTWVHNSCPPFVLFPTNPSVLGHIFRVAKGHYPINTPQTRAEIMSAVHNGQSSGPNQFGVTQYTRGNSDGTQTWVWVRNGAIYDAGYNPR